MNNVEDAYRLLADTLLKAASNEPWESLRVEAPILGKNLGGTMTWQKFGDDREIDVPVSWGIFDIQNAALFLRDDLLRTTGARIWGLTFTLYPDGKFSIEYDYNKPEGYEETGEVITGDEINQSLGGLADPRRIPGKAIPPNPD